MITHGVNGDYDHPQHSYTHQMALLALAASSLWP
jgi:hypothetical protein